MEIKIDVKKLKQKVIPTFIDFYCPKCEKIRSYVLYMIKYNYVGYECEFCKNRIVLTHNEACEFTPRGFLITHYIWENIY